MILHAETALLPEGWATDVRIRIAEGRIGRYSEEFEVKFSINFDRNVMEKYYDNQIIVPTDMDINEQIQEYKHYETDREEMHNLKQQMIKKMESPGITRPLLENRASMLNSFAEDV